MGWAEAEFEGIGLGDARRNRGHGDARVRSPMSRICRDK
jgi:hypothetical protein